MRSFWHRFCGAALLPLLILAGIVGPGGWFCADGSQCKPWFATTCCCGCDASDSACDDSCAAPADAAAVALAAPSCFCYYHAEETPPPLKAVPTGHSIMALPSVAAALAVPPRCAG